MPRMARVIAQNMPHHIVQRGHNRNAVFIENKDYLFYLNNLLEWKKNLGVKVYAWCLMTNHVHLILDPGENIDSIGLLMKRLAGRQTRYVNRIEGRCGSLWDGRYKASIIDRDAYLMQCCRYIDLNPVTANMLVRAEDYPWSSYRFKLGLGKSDILDYDECYLALSHPEVQYRAFVESGVGEDERAFLSSQIQRNQLTGGPHFVDEIERRLGVRVESRAPGRPAQTAGLTDK